MGINRISLFVLAMTSWNLSFAQPCDSIYIAGLDHRYNTDEKISFTIINQLINPVILSISLEEQYKNEWIELSDDILNSTFSKEVNVMIIGNGVNKNLVWDPNDLPRISLRNDLEENKVPIRGNFRLVMNWSYSPKESFNKCYSKMFSIQD